MQGCLANPQRLHRYLAYHLNAMVLCPLGAESSTPVSHNLGGTSFTWHVSEDRLGP